MSEPLEFVVDIEPGSGTNLRVRVQANGLAPIEDEVERCLPKFPAGDLDRLRSGDASERVAEALADLVTDWLLQSDLRGHLGTAFNAAVAPFRIVFRIHPKVLADLAEVPFELLKFNADPLVLQRQVRSIVHMQKRPRVMPLPAMRAGWPLGILLVRANPADLGGKVSPILPLRDHILSIAEARGLRDAVEVTTLTSEPGGNGPVTYDSLRRKLHDRRYSILVYLGHGDLQDAGFEELPPTGVLQFELESGPYASPIRANQLRNEMQNYPVPVVVLAGCSTAGSEAIARRTPQWMRGSQSVAQSLIYGESGVQCVIGMRYELETADAERFLTAFFQSLLADAPGDVEQAVRAGREDLFAHKSYPPSWSAPVLFRTTGAEPLFEWMSRAPGLIDPLDEHDQQLRQASWSALSSMPCTVPPEGRAFPLLLLKQMECGFVERWTQRGASVLWPAQIATMPGSAVRVGITYEGSLEVVCLEGRLSFPSALSVRAARPSEALKAAGFQVFFSLDAAGSAGFLIRSPDAEPRAIPAGALFDIDLAIPGCAPAVYDLSIENLQSEPSTLLRGWSNAVVVFQS
jgi:CHAT domain-containing protein